jgi:hypothetical protein
MIKISIINNRPKSTMLNPIECWGAPHGMVFQQYFNGEPQKEFLIGAGMNERPISIWYSDDSMNPEDPSYRISSESKKELKMFSDSVKYVEVDAVIDLILEVR